MRTGRWSVAGSLALLVAAAALPLAGVLVWSLASTFRLESNAASARVQEFAQAAAINAGRSLDNTRRLLQKLSERPLVRAMDRNRCDPMLAELRELMPEYANINVFNVQLEYLCSAIADSTGTVRRGNSPPVVERAVSTNNMALGDPVMGQIAKRWVMIAAYPVRSDSGELLGSMSMPVDLQVFSASVLGSLPGQALGGLVSESGYVVGRHPVDGRLGSKTADVGAKALAMKRGTAVEVDLDGVERVFGFAPVKGYGLYAIAGLPTAEVFADYRRHRDRTVLAIAVVLALAVLLALIAGRRITRPILALSRTADAVAGGARGMRAIPDGPREVAEVGSAINRMLDALQAYERDLAASEQRYRRIVETTAEGVLLLDSSGCITYANRRMAQMLGCAEADLPGHPWCEFMSDASRARAAELPGRKLPAPAPFEVAFVRRDGSLLWTLVNCDALPEEAGRPAGALAMITDISARHAAEERARRLNRLYTVLSRTNAAIVRLSDRDALFREICGICVEHGGFVMAYVGLLDGDEIKPVAGSGPARAFFEGLQLRIDGTTPQTSGPIATAIAGNRTYISNDYMNDPRTLPWRDRVLPIGVRASGTFLLRRADRIVGVLAVYAPEPHYFDTELVGLLDEMTADISFALENFEREALRVSAELALRDSEQRYRGLFENMSEAVMVRDAEGVCTDVNTAAERLFGLPRERLIGRRSLAPDLIPVDAAGVPLPAADLPGVRAAQERRAIQDAVYGLRRGDGSVIRVNANAQPMYRPGEDRPYRIIVTVLDITERYRAEQALRESEQRYRTLVESWPDAMLILADERVVLVNAAAVRLYGARDASELLGRKAIEFLDPADRASARERVRGVLDGGPAIRVQTRHRRIDGTVFDVELISIGFNYLGRPAVQTAVRDISERKRIERALEDANLRLHLLSRRVIDVQEAERSMMARELHDEIGQALTAMKLQLQSARKTADAARQHARIDDCIAIADTLLAQVRNLSLDLRPPQLDDLGLHVALSGHVNRFCAQAGLQAVFDAPALVPPISREIATACFRVAQEALTNVARHAGARKVDVRLSLADAGLQLVVADDGVGYDPEEAHGRALRGGSMGIVGMEERIAAVGGRLNIDSRPGGGTTVLAWFPIGRAQGI